MQIGSFATPDQVDAVSAAGGEYVEFFLTRTVTNLAASEFDDLTSSITTWPIKPAAFSGMVPSTLKVTGPDVDDSAVDEYLTSMFARVHRLCSDDPVVVFGSGGARSIPEDFDRVRALDQLEGFLRRAQSFASAEGISVALESLNRRESNVFNSLAESGTFLRQREIDGIVLIADLYHLMEENEPLAAIDEYADLIRHVHIADTDRVPPGGGSYPLVAFFKKLRENGYRGKCSIECVWTDFDSQIGAALEFCRVARDDAGW
jgi:sugar phosphate isomerase/epimerase